MKVKPASSATSRLGEELQPITTPKPQDVNISADAYKHWKATTHKVVDARLTLEKFLEFYEREVGRPWTKFQNSP